ncbi:MAG: sugar phosphate isomerase/epimerase family protein [Pirellulaceae bacterium]
MLLGYNTNGLAHHSPLDAIAVLADIGYRSVALTIDHSTLNPFSPRQAFERQLCDIRTLLESHGMRSVIETGARFLLDPWVKHEPTLVSSTADDRRRRIDFLREAIDIAAELGADCVSFWSGIARDDASEQELLDRLAAGLHDVIAYADQRKITLGFEPEPGMFIDTMAHFDRLLQWVDAPHFRLTLDVGHLYCQGEVPIADYIHRWGSRIVNVHLEDMRAGVHEHLMFGEGEMDFPPILKAIREVGYEGGVHVELSRHSHDGPNAARRAYEFLSPYFNDTEREQ